MNTRTDVRQIAKTTLKIHRRTWLLVPEACRHVDDDWRSMPARSRNAEVGWRTTVHALADRRLGLRVPGKLSRAPRRLCGRVVEESALAYAATRVRICSSLRGYPSSSPPTYRPPERYRNRYAHYGVAHSGGESVQGTPRVHETHHELNPSRSVILWRGRAAPIG